MKKFLALILAGVMAGPVMAVAEEPLQAIKVPIEKTIVILEDPQYKDPNH